MIDQLKPNQLSMTGVNPCRAGSPGRASVALWILLLVAGIGPTLAQDDCASVGCNSTSIASVLFPDTQATIYVNLRTICGSAVLNSCQVNFLSPPTLDPRLKCEELVKALSQGDCQGAGYEVSANRCVNGIPPTLVVTDPDFPQSVVEVGITCDPNVFTQTGQGQAICDYEGDVITPGDPATGTECISDGSMATDVTVSGTATGEEIVTTIPSTPHFALLVNLRKGELPINVQVLTGKGMSDEEIVQRAAEQIRGLGVPVEVLNDGKTLRLSGDALGFPIGVGAATNDVGITHATISGQADMLPKEFPPPFASLGECISTWILERCSDLTGRARAACNQDQQDECQLLFE